MNEITDNEIKDTAPPKEKQEMRLEIADDTTEREKGMVLEKDDDELSEDSNVEETKHSDTVSYVQSAEKFKEYQSGLTYGDNVPQPPEGRFVTSSESMDKILDEAQQNTEEKATEINVRRAAEKEEMLSKDPTWEELQGQGYEELEQAENEVDRHEPIEGTSNSIVEDQLGKPRGSLGDEQIYRIDVDVTNETVLEKPQGGEPTNNGMGVAEGVDEYVLKSPETYDESKISKY